MCAGKERARQIGSVELASGNGRELSGPKRRPMLPTWLAKAHFLTPLSVPLFAAALLYNAPPTLAASASHASYPPRLRRHPRRRLLCSPSKVFCHLLVLVAILPGLLVVVGLLIIAPRIPLGFVAFFPLV